MGASAGGVEALTRLLSRLPGIAGGSDRGFTPQSDVRVLVTVRAGCATPLTVVAAANDVPLQRGHVYVAIPDRHLLLSDHTIALKRDAKEHFHRPAVDPLFRSAARLYGARVVGVILCGAGSDGVVGAQAIKAAQGLVLAQDPTEAVHGSMPRAPIARSSVDAVLTTDRLAAVRVSLAAGEAVDGAQASRAIR